MAHQWICCATSRQKVIGQLSRRNILVSSVREEDRLLQQVLNALPGHSRERGGSNSGNDPITNCKETLAHIAYWDTLLVHHLRCQLRAMSTYLFAPARFDELDKGEMARTRDLSLVDVLGGYREATRSLISFVESHWDDLNRDQHQGLRIPLRHRRHHRITLSHALGLAPDGMWDAAGSDLAMEV